MVEFRILGPLEVWAGDRELKIGGLLARRILAVLLLNPDRVIEVARLAEAGWGEEPPATARRQVQNRVAELRAVLDGAGGAGVIASRESGYLLRLGNHHLDAFTFEELVQQARAATDPQVAVDHFRRALALWRGPLLDGLDGAPLETARASMEEKRLAAVEDCLDLELALGRHREVIAELRPLVARSWPTGSPMNSGSTPVSTCGCGTRPFWARIRHSTSRRAGPSHRRPSGRRSCRRTSGPSPGATDTWPSSTGW
jgi:DNA-binding SARP family transcriptional activator